MALRALSLLIACVTVAGALGCSKDTPTEPGNTGNAVLWDVGHVRLQADDFYIEADSVKYYANVANVAVGGSAGDSVYCTLELEWVEYAKDMRLYIYFEADSSHWWSDEIRTYDGAMNDGTRWIYYYGEFFKSPKGSTFVGDVTLSSDDSDNGVDGTLHFTNLRLTAFQ